MPELANPSTLTMIVAVIAGGLIGIAATWVTRAVYAVEDAFEHLPIQWMWWPALGGIAVGAVGLLVPRVLGVGYDNITAAVAGHFTTTALAGMVAMFAGASRALLTSMVFAVEATQEIHAIVPIVGGVTLAYVASAMLMRTTIMTEKLSRRGVATDVEIVVDVAAPVNLG